jgi:hypothetical protein
MAIVQEKEMCLKIIGHRNPDNNLESSCISVCLSHNVLVNCLVFMKLIGIVRQELEDYYLMLLKSRALPTVRIIVRMYTIHEYVKSA